MAGRTGYWDITVNHNAVDGVVIPSTFSYQGIVVEKDVTSIGQTVETDWYTAVSEAINTNNILAEYLICNYNNKNYVVTNTNYIVNAATNPEVNVTVIVSLQQQNDYTWKAVIRHNCTGKTFVITAIKNSVTILNQNITTNNQTFTLTNVTSETSIMNSITWSPTTREEGIYIYHFVYSVSETLFSFNVFNPAILNIYAEQNTNGSWVFTNYWVSPNDTDAEYPNNRHININDNDPITIAITYNGNTQSVDFIHSLSVGASGPGNTRINTNIISSYTNRLLSSSTATNDINFINNITYSPTLYYKDPNYKIQLGGIYFSTYMNYTTIVDIEFIQENTGYWNIKRKRDNLPYNSLTGNQSFNLNFVYNNEYTVKYIDGNNVEQQNFITYQNTYTTTLSSNLYTPIGESFDSSKLWWKISSHGTWYRLSNNFSENYSSCGISFEMTQLSQGSPVTKKLKWYYSGIVNLNSTIIPWTVTTETHNYTVSATITQNQLMSDGENMKWIITNLSVSPTTGVSGISGVSMPLTIVANETTRNYNITLTSGNQASSEDFGVTAVSTNIATPTYTVTDYQVVYQGVRHVFHIQSVNITTVPYPTSSIAEITVTLSLTQQEGGSWVGTIKRNGNSNSTYNFSITIDRNGTYITKTVSTTESSSFSTGWSTAEGTSMPLSSFDYPEYVTCSGGSISHITLAVPQVTFGQTKRIEINSASIQYTGTQVSPIGAGGGTATPVSLTVNYTKYIDYNGGTTTNEGTVNTTLYYNSSQFDLYNTAHRQFSIASKTDSIDSGNDPTVALNTSVRGKFNVNFDSETIEVITDNLSVSIYQQANHVSSTSSTTSNSVHNIINAYSHYNTEYRNCSAYFNPSSGSFAASGSPNSINVTAYETWDERDVQRQQYRIDTVTTTHYVYTYTSGYTSTNDVNSTTQGSNQYEYSYGNWNTNNWTEYRNAILEDSHSGPTTSLSFTSGNTAKVTASNLGTTTTAAASITLKYPLYDGSFIYATFNQAANTRSDTFTGYTNSSNSWEYSSWTSDYSYSDPSITSDYSDFDDDGTVSGTNASSITIYGTIDKETWQERTASQYYYRYPNYTYTWTSGSSESVQGTGSKIYTGSSYDETRNNSTSTVSLTSFTCTKQSSKPSSMTLSSGEIYSASRFTLSGKNVSAGDITGGSAVSAAAVAIKCSISANASPYYLSSAFNTYLDFHQEGFTPTDVWTTSVTYNNPIFNIVGSTSIAASGGTCSVSATGTYVVEHYCNGVYSYSDSPVSESCTVSTTGGSSSGVPSNLTLSFSNGTVTGQNLGTTECPSQTIVLGANYHGNSISTTISQAANTSTLVVESSDAEYHLDTMGWDSNSNTSGNYYYIDAGLINPLTFYGGITIQSYKSIYRTGHNHYTSGANGTSFRYFYENVGIGVTYSSSYNAYNDVTVSISQTANPATNNSVGVGEYSVTIYAHAPFNTTGTYVTITFTASEGNNSIYFYITSIGTLPPPTPVNPGDPSAYLIEDDYQAQPQQGFDWGNNYYIELNFDDTYGSQYRIRIDYEIGYYTIGNQGYPSGGSSESSYVIVTISAGGTASIYSGGSLNGSTAWQITDFGDGSAWIYPPNYNGADFNKCYSTAVGEDIDAYVL